ncbi:uncharacterized protein L201_007152 [Kwoniella dendrophila CBS 6074]|uniref:Stc1 domain-containing protein n=1 Tax=Kwoniella dendrophila CBS 6074 TaxID=1295534 RepID=A0AAX4K4U1_9TREE
MSSSHAHQDDTLYRTKVSEGIFLPLQKSYDSFNWVSFEEKGHLKYVALLSKGCSNCRSDCVISHTKEAGSNGTLLDVSTACTKCSRMKRKCDFTKRHLRAVLEFQGSGSMTDLRTIDARARCQTDRNTVSDNNASKPEPHYTDYGISPSGIPTDRTVTSGPVTAVSEEGSSNAPLDDGNPWNRMVNIIYGLKDE